MKLTFFFGFPAFIFHYFFESMNSCLNKIAVTGVERAIGRIFRVCFAPKKRQPLFA